MRGHLINAISRSLWYWALSTIICLMSSWLPIISDFGTPWISTGYFGCVSIADGEIPVSHTLFFLRVSTPGLLAVWTFQSLLRSLQNLMMPALGARPCILWNIVLLCPAVALSFSISSGIVMMTSWRALASAVSVAGVRTLACG